MNKERSLVSFIFLLDPFMLFGRSLLLQEAGGILTGLLQDNFWVPLALQG